jgi:RNA polymerase sigma factor (sigma-70 family)
MSAKTRGRTLKDDRRNGEVASLLAEFAPLVRRIAGRYAGRGAEWEDLVQEGGLALVSIARRCTRKQMARQLKNLLPGKVRDAARRMRRPEGELSLDEESEPDAPGLCIPDERALRGFEDIELADFLENLPNKTDRDIAKAASQGVNPRQIALSLKMKPQTVAYRLARIKDALDDCL